MVAVVDKTFTLHDPSVWTPTATVLDVVSAIAAEIGLHGGTWSVVDDDVVSTNGRQILLESSDPDMAGVKIPIFGGVSPNAANVASTANNASIYAGLHINHAADAFDANFDASQTLTGPGWVPAQAWLGSVTYNGFTANKIRLLTKGDLIVIAIYDDTDAAPLGWVAAGCIGRTFTGQQILGVIGTGSATHPTNAWSTNGAPSYDPGPPLSASGMRAWVPDAAAAKGVARLWQAILPGPLAVMTDRAGTGYFRGDIPIHDSDNYMIGYLQQMRFGRKASLFVPFVADSGQTYIPIAAGVGTAQDALWFVQPAP
jgi:hypothetical protein